MCNEYCVVTVCFGCRTKMRDITKLPEGKRVRASYDTNAGLLPVNKYAGEVAELVKSSEKQ